MEDALAVAEVVSRMEPEDAPRKLVKFALGGLFCLASVAIHYEVSR